MLLKSNRRQESTERSIPSACQAPQLNPKPFVPTLNERVHSMADQSSPRTETENTGLTEDARWPRWKQTWQPATSRPMESENVLWRLLRHGGLRAWRLRGDGQPVVQCDWLIYCG